MDEFIAQFIENIEDARVRIEKAAIEGTISSDTTTVLELIEELIEELEVHQREE